MELADEARVTSGDILDLKGAETCYAVQRGQAVRKKQIDRLSEDERIDEALRLETLDLPKKPRIVGLEWAYYEDTQGEDSLKVTVILADSTTDSDILIAPIHEIKRAIMESLDRQGIELFPYFFFERPSEREALRQEE